jgi:hypothetical protein
VIRSEHLHSIRPIPLAGHFTVTCSAQPKMVFYTYGKPKRCPVCRELSPEHFDAVPVGPSNTYSGTSVEVERLIPR